MPLATAIREKLFDPDEGGVVSSAARAKRARKFAEVFPDIAEMKVLDLGGRPSYWAAMSVRPAHVRCVNLEPTARVVGGIPNESWVEYVEADATTPQPGTYDLVVSNSLIEHVGGHEPRLRLAEAVHAAADRHWVQTPYRYFPVEPHWIFPGFQFLPMPVARSVSERWKVGHIRSSRESSWSDVAWVELLTKTDMRHYFPDATLWTERWMGLPKSLVSIRT